MPFTTSSTVAWYSCKSKREEAERNNLKAYFYRFLINAASIVNLPQLVINCKNVVSICFVLRLYFRPFCKGVFKGVSSVKKIWSLLIFCKFVIESPLEVNNFSKVHLQKGTKSRVLNSCHSVLKGRSEVKLQFNKRFFFKAFYSALLRRQR